MVCFRRKDNIKIEGVTEGVKRWVVYYTKFERIIDWDNNYIHSLGNIIFLCSCPFIRSSRRNWQHPQSRHICLLLQYPVVTDNSEWREQNKPPPSQLPISHVLQIPARRIKNRTEISGQPQNPLSISVEASLHRCSHLHKRCFEAPTATLHWDQGDSDWLAQVICPPLTLTKGREILETVLLLSHIGAGKLVCYHWRKGNWLPGYQKLPPTTTNTSAGGREEGRWLTTSPPLFLTKVTSWESAVTIS